MKTKVVQIRLAGIVILLLIAVIVAGGVIWKLRNDRLYAELDEANSRIKFYKIVVANQVEAVAETKLQLRAKEKDLRLSEEQVERLKQLNIRNVSLIGELNLKISAIRDSLTIYKNAPMFRVDTVIREVQNVEGKPMIELPISFGDQDKWATSWAKVDVDGLGTTGFALDTVPLHIVLGQRGLLAQQNIATITTPNPYVTVDKAHVQLVQKKNYSPFIFVGGVAIGITLSAILVSLF